MRLDVYMTELPSCNLEAMLSHVCTGQARSRGIRISYLMYWVCPWEAPCYKIGVARTHNPRNVISQSISSSACLKSTPSVLPPSPLSRRKLCHLQRKLIHLTRWCLPPIHYGTQQLRWTMTHYTTK